MSADHDPTIVRLRLAFFTAALVPLGIGTKLYAGPGAAWMNGNVGGFVYVVFWCTLALVVWPRLSAARAAWTVLIVTSALEALQLWHPPLLEAVRSTLAGQALLGSHFSWWDYPYYVAGAVAAVGVARLVGRR